MFRRFAQLLISVVGFIILVVNQQGKTQCINLKENNYSNTMVKGWSVISVDRQGNAKREEHTSLHTLILSDCYLGSSIRTFLRHTSTQNMMFSVKKTIIWSIINILASYMGSMSP